MPVAMNNAMSARAWTMLLLLSLLWGGSFFFIGVAVKELPPLMVVLLRVGIAALALWSFALVIGLRPPKDLAVWRTFLGMGLLNNAIPFSLIVWGQTHIASGLASILNAATPVFGVMVAGLLLPDERPTPLKLLGALIGFGGVVVMIGTPQLTGSGDLLAELAIVGAAISYAFASVYGRRFQRLGINPVITAAGQVTASSFILVPMVFLFEGFNTLNDVSSQAWAAVLALALISTATAYVLYFKILAVAGATNVLLVTLLVPVSAILLGAGLLNETISAIHLLGMLLIALGLSAIDGRLWRKFMRKSAAVGP